jgi:anti-anti-sigma regulatory factor
MSGGPENSAFVRTGAAEHATSTNASHDRFTPLMPYTSRAVDFSKGCVGSILQTVQLGAEKRTVGCAIVSAMQHADARLALQHDLSRVLASARQVRDAAPVILEAISARLGCVVSELWVIDEPRSVLESVGTWAKSAAYRSFTRTDDSFVFRKGDGLPGLCWQRNAPQWMTDVSEDAKFERRLAARTCDLRAAVAFPTVFGDSVNGVVQFFYPELREPDVKLIETFADIGEQIGLFLERARTDAIVFRQARELLELSAPILRVAPHAILLPIIGTFDARRAVQVTERLLAKVVEAGARVVVLDVTSAGAMDTFMAQRILDAVAAVRLLGARTILTGVQPAAARTLALLGIDFQQLEVCSTLAEGLLQI